MHLEVQEGGKEGGSLRALLRVAAPGDASSELVVTKRGPKGFTEQACLAAQLGSTVGSPCPSTHLLHTLD